MSATSSRQATRPPLPLHRVRFFDHTPSPITALAYAPTPLPAALDPSAKGKGKQEQPTIGVARGTGLDGQPELGVLILARENGDVEIWEWTAPEGDGQGNWVLEKVLPPTLTHPGVSLMCLVIRDPAEFQHKPYAVPRLADLRLYTAGSDSGDITERCLFTGRILQAYTIPSAPLWAMSVSPTHQLLCLATTSPNLHFLSITSTGLEPAPSHLLRTDALPSRTKTVSIAWGPPRCVKSPDDANTWSWSDTYLVTGNSDSSFRKFDLPPSTATSGSASGNGRVTLSGRSVVEKQSKGSKKNGKGTIVWGVSVLPDHTIVTADSLGSVGFWDGASLAQKQIFRAHKADAMCMTMGADGRSVFTSGPDQRVCQFVRVDASPVGTVNGSASAGAGGGGGEWALTTTKRAHQHDVRALACFPAYTPVPLSHPSHSSPAPSSTQPMAPVLASGGWDMTLILTPCASPSFTSAPIRLRNPLGRSTGGAKVLFEEAYPRKMGYLAGARGTGRVSVSRTARLVLGRKERSVGVWKLHADEAGWEKMLDMDFRLRTALTCAVLSEDGKWMAVSDLYETKLFALRPSTEGTGTLVPKRIKSFLPTLLEFKALEHLDLQSTGTGSSTILFTPDSGRLVLGLAMSGQVVVLELDGSREARGGGEVRVAQVFKRDDITVGGRVIVGKKEMGANGGGKKAGKGKGKGKGAVNGDVDVDMDANNDNTALAARGEDEEDEDDGHEDEESGTEDMAEGKVPMVGPKQGWVACMAVSADGQWLAVSDLLGKVSVFNLDTLRPHATLPTFPSAPLALLSPPTHPSLFALILPSNSIVMYDAETRTLLQPTVQLSKLNKALQDQFNPISGGAFEPIQAPPSAFSPLSGAASASGGGDVDFTLLASALGSGTGTSTPPPKQTGTSNAKADARNVKLVLWSNDWVCSARLDLEMIQKEGQRKRRGGSANAAAAAAAAGGTAGPGSAGGNKAKSATAAGVKSAAVNGSATGTGSGVEGTEVSEPQGERLSKAVRRKRAREAREARDALERSSIASSPSVSVSVSGPGSTAGALVNGHSSIPPSPLSAGTNLAPSSTSNGTGTGTGPTQTSPVVGSTARQQAYHHLLNISSASDPDFYRFTHDAFRSLAAVEWMGKGEMMVVERPMRDFVGDLPGAFFVGTYGRG